MEMKVMIAQVNPTVGDLEGNLRIIQQRIANAVQISADVVVFPELVSTGYPPRDLLYTSRFWNDHDKLIVQLVNYLNNIPQQITAIIGGLHQEMKVGGRYARYNAAWILDRHYGKRVIHKKLLPCYDVFDETRYFSTDQNEPYCPIPIHVVKHSEKYDVPCDVLICEDIWNNEFRGNEDWMKPATYLTDPVSDVALHGQGPLFVLNGSPFWIEKIKQTEILLQNICQRIQQPVVWVNQVGAHDDIITGGYSMVVLPPGGKKSQVAIRRAAAFTEDEFFVRLSIKDPHRSDLYEDQSGLMKAYIVNNKIVEPSDFDLWTIYKALCLHMTDYKRRCGFKRAVLGLSGGIDSAVVAVIAAHVFGSENVTGIAMPSPYSSKNSIEDAQLLANTLAIRFQIKPITPIYENVKKLFLTGGKQKFDNSLTDENIQPRIRGMILMTYSNEYEPCLLLTTGNKSEITVGYCTIYGDMCGGLAVISDLWKTEVYALAKFINKYFGVLIPENIITKPPSAELRLDQTDTESLPPYDILDPILRLFVEQEMNPQEIFESQQWSLLASNIHSETVNELYRKYRRAEYKRQQMPPGAKLQQRSFGSGRRMPIAMKMTGL